MAITSADMVDILEARHYNKQPSRCADNSPSRLFATWLQDWLEPRRSWRSTVAEKTSTAWR